MTYINVIDWSSNFRPPLFDGTSFSIWKTRFHIYARSQGLNIWMRIKDATIIPTDMYSLLILVSKRK